MTKTVTLQSRVPEGVKEDFTELCVAKGVTASDALRAYAEWCTGNGDLEPWLPSESPSVIRSETKERNQTGSAHGSVASLSPHAPQQIPAKFNAISGNAQGGVARIVGIDHAPATAYWQRIHVDGGCPRCERDTVQMNRRSGKWRCIGHHCVATGILVHLADEPKQPEAIAEYDGVAKAHADAAAIGSGSEDGDEE